MRKGAKISQDSLKETDVSGASVAFEYACKYQFINISLRQYLALSEANYVLGDDGKVYRFLPEFSPAQPVYKQTIALEFATPVVSTSKILHIAGVDHEAYILDSQMTVYSVRGDQLKRFGHLMNGKEVSGFYVVRYVNDLFFFIDACPSYSFYKKIDLRDGNLANRTHKYCSKRNLFGENANDRMLCSAQRDSLLMFVTVHPVSRKTYAFIVDVIGEEVLHSFNLSNFDILKGAIIDKGHYLFLTVNNELLYVYHLSEMINSFLTRYGAELDSRTERGWERHRSKTALPAQANNSSAYLYGKQLKAFIEEYGLIEMCGPFLNKLNAIMDQHESFGCYIKSLEELDLDFRHENFSVSDVYFSDFLYIICRHPRGDLVYKYDIRFESS